MKKVVRSNVTNLPFSLHDQIVIGFAAEDNRLEMLFESGFLSITGPLKQVQGKIEFEKVDWDFCHVYVLEFPEGHCNLGNFQGKKMELLDFIKQNKNIRFEIIDETYGYNTSKFDGYLWDETSMKECMVEIYHLGDMNYLIEEEEGEE